jgi:hypothetical protein
VPTDNGFDVFVISTPSSDRGIPLLNTLKKSGKARVHVIEATMYSAAGHVIEIDRTGQRAMYGRLLADGEIGCSMSHQAVYQLIIELSKGAVVLEDDARIPNLLNFENLVSDFLGKSQESAKILSLLPWIHEDGCSEDELDSPPKLFTLSGKTPLTVGYVISLEGAVRISQANLNYRYLADWPPAKVQYFSSIVGVVNHGDQESGSLITASGRVLSERQSRTQRVLDVALLDFQRNRGIFTTYRLYFRYKVLPSITWRFDNFRGKRKAKKLTG